MAPTTRTLPGFTIYGPPRTKKNSQDVIFMTPKGQKRIVCRGCNRAIGRAVPMPSDAYRAWEIAALGQIPEIRAKLAQRGVLLPVAGLVSIEAKIYREASTGDTAGFHQAIGDMLQKAGI